MCYHIRGQIFDHFYFLDQFELQNQILFHPLSQQSHTLSNRQEWPKNYVFYTKKILTNFLHELTSLKSFFLICKLLCTGVLNVERVGA